MLIFELSQPRRAAAVLVTVARDIPRDAARPAQAAAA
jgi:hypothetical protein